MGPKLEQRVATQLARAAVRADGAILAMVSGGADSVCLVDVLHRVHPGRLGVLTIDHGLRPQAAAECAMVAELARERGLPVWRERLNLEPGANLLARARDERQAVAERVRGAQGFDVVALGHTASDQAETVLFNLARGTGRTGAAGMSVRNGTVIRPLLTATRDETRRWCADRGLAFVDDPTNTDRSYARVRVRDELVPALERIHPGAQLAVARFAEQMADEAALLAPIVDGAWDECARGDGLMAAQLVAHPPALARILIHRLLVQHEVAVSSQVVARALDLAAAGRGRFDAPGGTVCVDRGVLMVTGKPPATPEAVEVRPGEQVAEVRFGAHRIRIDRGPAPASTPSRVALRDDQVVRIRSLQPGDRIRLPHAGRIKVAHVLADGGVPERLRGQVPIVVDALGRVVWVAGYRADPHVLAAPGESAIRLEMV